MFAAVCVVFGFLIGLMAAWWATWAYLRRLKTARERHHESGPVFTGDFGRIVYDQFVFPVVAMWLEDGKVHCLGRRKGPLEPLAHGAHGLTIYAPDGTVVVSALVVCGWEAIPADATVHFDQSFTNEWNGVVEGR